MSAVHDGATDDRKRNKKRALVVIAGLVAASGVGSLAFAYWTESGSTTGNATTDGTSAVTLNVTSADPAGLYPGGPAQTVTGTFTNSNSSAVTLKAVSASLTVQNGQADPNKPACTAADFAFSNPTIGGQSSPSATGVVVPSGTGVGSWSIKVAMNNLTTNQDNCKNVTLDLTYNAS